jgi:ubiquinone/menaquinone biosynthesis C-methylase UbiE/aminoglycoside phosphotransferase (APT) family kinase protein
VDGIPVFARDREHYYGFIPKDAIEQVLAGNTREGWDEAVGELLQARPRLLQKLSRRAFDESRAVGKFLLSLNEQSRVLDLGCGLGALSLNFARSCGEVVAMDLTLEHLQWIRAGAAARGLNNIVPICGGDRPHLPFPDNSFDAVLLNGVLEWVPVGAPGNPTDAQRAFLREVARVLRSDGQIYLAIENRLSARYFWGRPEEHVKMRFAALLPRWLSNLLLKKTRGQEFRVYTYTMRGYRCLLSEAGFLNQQFFSPTPRYQEIRHLIALDAKARRATEPAATFVPRRGWDRWNGSLIGRCFVRSFAIVGSRDKGLPNVLGELLAAARTSCINPKLQSVAWNLDEFEVRQRTGKLHLHLRTKEDARFLGKVPLHPLAQERTHKSYEVLNFLHQSSAVSAATKSVLPRVWGSAHAGLHEIYLEEWRPGAHVPKRGPLKARAGGRAMEFLIRLHRETQERQVVDEALFDEQFQRRFEELRRWFSADEAAQWENALRRLEEYCREQVLGATLPLVTMHGDFGLTNCLFDPRSHELATVVDWDWAEQRGLPLLDALNFMLRLDARARPAGNALRERGLRGFPAVMFDEAHRMLYAEYLQTMGIEERLVLPLSIMYWIQYTRPKRERYRWDAKWREENIVAVLSEWTQSLHL